MTVAANNSAPGMLFGDQRLYPEGEVIHEIVERRAKEAPDNVALVHGPEQLTYGELSHQSGAIAAGLAGRGVGGTIVGVLLPRGIDLVVAVLSVLRSGAAYVALDDAWPETRLKAFLRGARASMCVVDSADRGRGLGVKRIPLADLATGCESNFSATVEGGDPFSVLATSGTTGDPKGVLVPHRGLIRILLDREFAPYDRRTVVLQAAPLPWDMFAFELWSALLSGGTSVLAVDRHLTAPALRGVIADRGVNALYLTATLLNTLVDEDPDAFTGIRAMVTGGERASVPHIRRLLEAQPGLHFVHGYGPAEGTCATTRHVVTLEDLPPGAVDVPIGGPLPNTDVFLADPGAEDGGTAELQPVREEEPGEIFIGGDGVGLGYLDESSSRRFVTAEVPGLGLRRFYRTGDLARRRSDGSLVFVGRADRQVKVRGHRVEPGEVEAHLRLVDGVLDAVVLPLRDDEQERVRDLVAYYTTDPREEIAEGSVRARLAGALPDYMLPRHYVHLDELPLNASGKVARDALPAVVNEHPSPQRSDSEWSGDPKLKTVAEVMGDVLEREEPLAADDDFIGLGADSLLATRVAGRLYKLFGTEVKVTDVLAAPTPALLLARIEDRRTQAYDIPVPRAVRWPVEATDAQMRMWLAEALDPGGDSNLVTSVHQLPRRVDPSALELALADVMRSHEILRTAYTEEPGRLMQELREPPDVVPVKVSGQRSPASLASDAGEFVDLADGTPIGAALGRSGESDILALAVHHIATDALSELLMLQSLSRAYRARLVGAAPELPDAPGYGVYARWFERRLKQVGREQEAYWQERLTGTPALRWSIVDAAPDRDTPLGGEPVEVTADVVAGLTAKAAALGSTLYAVLLTAFHQAISRVAEQQDFAIGVAVSGRKHPNFESTMGCFVNTVAVRPRLQTGQEADAAVRAVTASLHSAFANDDLPFNRVVSALAPAREVTHPIVQSYFVLQPRMAGALDFGQGNVRRLPPVTAGGTPFDLYLELWPAAIPNEPLSGELHFRPDIVGPSFAGQIVQSFHRCLKALDGGSGR